MSEKLTVLFGVVDGEGHMYASIGIAQQLLRRGHKIVFATPNTWKGKLEPLGFIEACLDEAAWRTDEALYEFFKQICPLFTLPPIEKMEHLHVNLFQHMVETTKTNDSKFRKIIADVKPDVIVVDILTQNPAVVASGIPWVLTTSVNPMTISTKNVPPALSGYPIIHGDKALWKLHAEKEKEYSKKIFQNFNSWLLENYGQELKYSNLPFWLNYSPYGNVYQFPMELSYTSFRPDPQNWYRCDAILRTEDEIFKVPAELENLPGKLIYLSMGTWGCFDLQLMKRLFGILANSPHRFIVSKGPMGHEMELPSNMWGAMRLPQTNVIPLMDLVITHGGTNTIKETFYFGKRIFVLPLCFDHIDNARRIEETGLGLHFQPHHVTEEELLSGIEKLLGDEMLEKRMKAISQRIQASNPQTFVADLIENAAKKGSRH